MWLKFNQVSKFVLIINALIVQALAIFFANNGKNNMNLLDEMRKILADFSEPIGHKEETTRFDELMLGPMRLLREITFATFNTEAAFEHNARLGKTQTEITADTPFPCDLTNARSAKPPKTVNELRPGDIDIIAVIGDSMSAGMCLMTESFLQLPYENRGIVFSGGGVGNWRKFLTLPNILKVFNPNLYGYTIADGPSYQKTSRFNVAESVAMSRDLVYQVKNLIKRMRQDPNVDFQNHWKLLTMFIGNVDFCDDYCYYKDPTIPLRYHEQDLRQSLALLRDNVPHLLVNLIPAPNSIQTFRKMKVPPPCYLLHRSFCFCVLGANQTEADVKEYSKRIRLWQNVDAYVANLDEFNTDDFAVIHHSFFLDPMPVLPNGDVDQRYFGADCFHLSQLGHAALANNLWNSMLQPVEHRQTYPEFVPFKHFECPSLERPYFATKYNSYYSGF